MLFFYYYLISLSILGYGLMTNRFLKINLENIGSIGLVGIFFLTLLSYLSSILIPHDYTFNTSILIIGIILMIYFFFKKRISYKNFFIHFFVFIILYIFILNGKNHDDFPYYHFPYTYLLTQDSHPLGLGLLNTGFRNPSSLFYLNSLFFLPKINIYLFHIGSVFFLGYANLFLIKNIFDKEFFQKFRFYNFLNLFSFIFINIFFYRLSEYGTDRAGQILIILSFVILILIINRESDKFEKKNNELFHTLIIIVCLATTLKPFYILYFSLIFLIFFHKNLRILLFNLIKKRIFYISLLLVLTSFLITFINSGCFIFPLSFTCFENLDWAVPKQQVINTRVWYELWSKAGASPNFVVENQYEYIAGLNWLSNWMENYFFNKMSDYILSLILVSTILFFIFKKSNYKIQFERKYNLLLLFLIFYLLEWFINHPSLRYGGYHIFMLIFFIPLTMILENYKLNFEEFKKKSLYLIMITLIIFFGRNVARLNKEFNNYNYNIFKNTNYKFTEDKKNYFRYQKKIEEKDFNFEYKNFFYKKFLIIKLN